LNKQVDQEFTEFLRSKAAEAKRAFGFPATAFLGMLGADGGYMTACKLLGRKIPSDGFTDLWEHHRLDLTVEALVVETKWRTYFDELLIARAESLLRKSNYAFRPFLPVASDPVENEVERDETDIVADQQEEAIKGRTDIGATSKEELVKSRRGQGVFKANVRLNEKGCRVTGVTDLLHLRASHIKPWKDSTDEEKLNGCNGLLLAPHIDHLFDRGFISFSEEGSLLISKQVDQIILIKWGISKSMNVGHFNAQQIEFLKYHMHSVLKK
jgi:hypothetical protein